MSRKAFWLETMNGPACEIARSMGYDIVIYDMEHGAISETALDWLAPFCRNLGLEVHVRLANSERSGIQHALDSGADAIIVPQIRSLDDARAAAALAKYPPQGTRGLGYNRTMQYGAATDALLAQENSRRPCYVMIETPGALEAVKDIAALPNVDGLFIGPGDLSLSRGRGVFRASDADLADIASVARVAREAGKRWAVPALNPRVRALCRELEAEYVAVGDDLSALVRGFASLIETD